MKGIYVCHNKTCRGKWFPGLSRNSSALRRTQVLPTRHLYRLQCINHISTHAHKMATTVPNITFSCHMMVSEVVKKREVKAPSYYLSLLEREQRFSQKPQHIVPSVLLARIGPPHQLWLQEGTERKEQSISLFNLGKWAVPGGKGWMSLPLHQAWGGRRGP